MEKIRISASINSVVCEAIKEKSKKEGRSFSEMIDRITEKWFENEKKKS